MKKIKYNEWVCPKGTHHARITDASIIWQPSKGGDDEEVICIRFQLTSLQHPLKVFQAKKFYRCWDIKNFIEDFSMIIGEETVARMFDSDSELIPASLATIKGLEVDIEIVHQHNLRFPDPLCIVSKIEPCGALVPDLDYAV